MSKNLRSNWESGSVIGTRCSASTIDPVNAMRNFAFPRSNRIFQPDLAGGHASLTIGQMPQFIRNPIGLYSAFSRISSIAPEFT